MPPKLTQKQHDALKHILKLEKKGRPPMWEAGKSGKYAGGIGSAHPMATQGDWTHCTRAVIDGLIKKGAIVGVFKSGYKEPYQAYKPGVTKPYLAKRIQLKTTGKITLSTPVKAAPKKASKSKSSTAQYDAMYADDVGVVRVKVVGGAPDYPLFQGYDSKGRSKYEMIPPKGENAYSVADQLRQAVKSGKKLFGGDVYVIRVAFDGKEYDYYKVK